MMTLRNMREDDVRSLAIPCARFGAITPARAEGGHRHAIGKAAHVQVRNVPSYPSFSSVIAAAAKSPISFAENPNARSKSCESCTKLLNMSKKIISSKAIAFGEILAAIRPAMNKSNCV